MAKKKNNNPKATRQKHPASQKPYLSVVVTARNDDHGGRLLERMQLFVDSFLYQAEQAKLSSELIIVEWNPCQDKPGLKKALTWPNATKHVSVRLIEVPLSVHSQYENSKTLPLYQMIAKNAGIKRARGEFVLATNIDVLFSQELFDFMAKGDLKANRMYRVDRNDVPQDLPRHLPLSELLNYCSKNIIRLNKREGTQSFIDGNFRWIRPPKDKDDNDFYANREILHTNTCGDFTLLHKNIWNKLKGYPEFDAYSFHLDSILCFMAHFGGAQELALEPPMVCYHIEHKGGWAPEKTKEQELKQNLEAKSIPVLSNSQFDSLAARMTEDKKPIIFNNDNWGLEDQKLPETFIIKALYDDYAPCAIKENKKTSPNKTSDFKPYLSIVAAGRNDDHGVNFIERSQSCLDVLALQCQKYNFNVELILVDWNTPKGKKPLGQKLKTPPLNHPLKVRFIEVPKDLHQTMGNWEKIPFFQMVAKNVGIRRAEGRFVLATNMDIVLSNELIEFLALENLDSNCLYRVDRHDIKHRLLPSYTDIDQLMGLLEKDVVRVHKKENRDLHTNACGDFTLLAKEKWLELNGYPELGYYSLYIDAVLLYMAFVAKIKEIELPKNLKAYHIEHDNSWSITKAPTLKMPTLDYEKDMVPWYKKMLMENQVINPNSENWGFAQKQLKETDSPINKPTPQVTAIGLPKVELKPFTIFATPKPFVGHLAIIQENALKSWQALNPKPEVILLGDEKGIAEQAEKLGFIHIPEVKRNQHGTPLVNDIFAKAKDKASHEIMAYVNADIILTQGFSTALAQTQNRFERFLMIGQRWDLDQKEKINFNNPDWESSLLKKVKEKATLHAVTGIDYFAFKGEIWPEIPPFALGRVAWDNWLVYQPLKNKIPVVDAGSLATIVHQNHDYNHVKGGYTRVWYGPEAVENRTLAGPESIIGVTASAFWELTRLGFLMRPTKKVSRNSAGSLAVELCQQAVTLITEGKPELGLEKLDKAHELSNGMNLVGLNYTRAYALMQLDKPQQAKAAAQAELAISFHQQAQLIVNMVDQGQNNLSLPSQKTQKEKDSIQEILAKGEELYKAGRLKEAEELFIRINKANPENPEIINDLCVIYWQTNRKKLALEWLEKSFTQNPKHKGLAWNLGQFKRAMGDLLGAIAVFEAYQSKNKPEIDFQNALNQWKRQKATMAA